MRSIYSSSLECTWMHFLHDYLVMIHILHTAIFMLRVHYLLQFSGLSFLNGDLICKHPRVMV
jgi:hypothetical protein